MISIKKASIDDLEIIQELNNKLSKKESIDFDTTVNPLFATTEQGTSYFKRMIEDEDNIVLIAKDEGNPIGYIAAGIEKVGSFRIIPNLCEIDNMWIDEPYRSQGIGRKLIEEVTTWANSKGIKRMRVIASYDNIKAINFYKREGFSEYDLILEKDI